MTRLFVSCLILLAFITGNNGLEPLLEGLFAQIHIDLSSRGFCRNRTGDLRITQICQVPRSSPLSYGDGYITEDPSGSLHNIQRFFPVSRTMILNIRIRFRRGEKRKVIQFFFSCPFLFSLSIFFSFFIFPFLSVTLPPSAFLLFLMVSMVVHYARIADFRGNSNSFLLQGALKTIN